MKRLLKILKELSAKQFKTYAAAILISAVSFQTLATETEEGIEVEPWMVTPFEVSLDEELFLETWMTVPFDVSLDEELFLETWMTVPFDVSIEEELALETWMTVPFHLNQEHCQTNRLFVQ